MEEKQISGQESLLIIQQMINTAKKEQKDNGMGWIIWGWLLFLASVFTYINIKTQWRSTWFFWNLFGILTLAVLLYQVIRNSFFRRKDRVRTYMKDLFQKLNVGFFIMLFFVILAMNLGGVSPLKGFAMLIAVYGFWILIYGALLEFRPSIIGAFVTWAFGVGALFAESFDQTMLIHAAAVLFGYIVPGHIAYKEFNKIKSR